MAQNGTARDRFRNRQAFDTAATKPVAARVVFLVEQRLPIVAALERANSAGDSAAARLLAARLRRLTEELREALDDLGAALPPAQSRAA